jgi:hypothetical protein
MKIRFINSTVLRFLRLGSLIIGLLTLFNSPPSLAVGFWTPLAHTAPDSVELMLQLPDGTVMGANNPSDISGSQGHNWYRLTPDGHGNYANGTWTTLAAMHDTRLFYSSAVLRDGRVFVAGGEYGSGRDTAEIYDPQANTWTYINPPTSLIDPNAHSPALGATNASGNQGFIDSDSIVIADGRVLIAPVAPNTWGGTLLYDPVANSWSAGPTTATAYQDEASWVKLPDGSILTIDPFGTNTERYIPALNQWIPDRSVPTSLYSPVGGEMGPAFLLPDGRAFFLGGSGHTAYYTPSGNTSLGTWTTGPDIPNGLTAADAPAAMMVNGKILCAVAPAPYKDGSGNTQFPTPTSFYEFDPVGNTFTQTTSPAGGMTDNIASYQCTMLDLPDGTVLYCHVEQGNLFYSSFGSQLYAYTPGGVPVTSGKPTITGISLNNDGSYHLTGLGLNGISQGAAYGDDAQMDSNFPLVRLTDGSGNVYYARTYNWSSTGVMTGNTPVSTEFKLPGFLPAGPYSLAVVANGISSDPVSFSGPIYVEFGYGGFQFGTIDFPFATMAQGVAHVPVAGEIILEGAGSSAETMTISTPMTITAIGGPSTIGH